MFNDKREAPLLALGDKIDSVIVIDKVQQRIHYENRLKCNIASIPNKIDDVSKSK